MRFHDIVPPPRTSHIPVKSYASKQASLGLFRYLCLFRLTSLLACLSYATNDGASGKPSGEPLSRRRGPSLERRAARAGATCLAAVYGVNGQPAVGPRGAWINMERRERKPKRQVRHSTAPCLPRAGLSRPRSTGHCAWETKGGKYTCVLGVLALPRGTFDRLLLRRRAARPDDFVFDRFCIHRFRSLYDSVHLELSPRFLLGSSRVTAPTRRDRGVRRVARRASGRRPGTPSNQARIRCSSGNGHTDQFSVRNIPVLREMAVSRSVLPLQNTNC